MSTSYFYKTQAPCPVAIIEEFHASKDLFLRALETLGQQFGGEVAPMRDITSNFAGGVKLSAGQGHDVHWRLPDEYGYRSLRVAARLPKGSTKEDRTAARSEHQRLLDLWQAYCPSRLSIHDTWDRLNINTGNLLLCGGIFFIHDSSAFFELGFQINEVMHAQNIATGKPSAGWIEGAVEITSSDYQAARSANQQARKVAKT
ncbi:hypothetical protein PSCICO_15260 [Pseudomonas cichorii]|uniref:hypothetical protein n=1 Tax=Pseudomonas cichorii TaxID=36746 RepID=UPI001910BB17|nr:hypothetical protein [Pseudomonas cichorii]GFM86127.1 hypothetical protein PSCICO_15260 [Pseudomonas cichorii]